MSKQIQLHNWSVGLVPDPLKLGRIVALFGTLPDGKFLPGSGRIVSFDKETSTAVSESGTQYVLGEPDPTPNPDDQPQNVAFLQAAINKFSK